MNKFEKEKKRKHEVFVRDFSAMPKLKKKISFKRRAGICAFGEQNLHIEQVLWQGKKRDLCQNEKIHSHINGI